MVGERSRGSRDKEIIRYNIQGSGSQPRAASTWESSNGSRVFGGFWLLDNSIAYVMVVVGNPARDVDSREGTTVLDVVFATLLWVLNFIENNFI